MERLKRKEVDVALAQNDTPGLGSVRSIALLFPELLQLTFAMTPQSSAWTS